MAIHCAHLSTFPHVLPGTFISVIFYDSSVALDHFFAFFLYFPQLHFFFLWVLLLFFQPYSICSMVPSRLF